MEAATGDSVQGESSVRSDQRFVALVQANAVRARRKEFKQRLKRGGVDPRETISNPEEYLMSARVNEFLGWCPKLGEVRASRILRKCEITSSKTLGDLTQRQRALLVNELAQTPVLTPVIRGS